LVRIRETANYGYFLRTIAGESKECLSFVLESFCGHRLGERKKESEKGGQMFILCPKSFLCIGIGKRRLCGEEGKGGRKGRIIVNKGKTFPEGKFVLQSLAV